MNPYQIPYEFISSTPAGYFYRLVESGSGNFDIAIAFGGPHSGRCIRIDSDTLVPEVKAVVVADSFTELFWRLLQYKPGGSTQWLMEGPHISLTSG